MLNQFSTKLICLFCYNSKINNLRNLKFSPSIKYSIVFKIFDSFLSTVVNLRNFIVPQQINEFLQNRKN